MNVETMIYAYLAICLAMIVFNCACIFVFRHQGKTLKRHSDRMEDEIEEQIFLIQKGDPVSEEHLTYICKKLRKIRNLMAFDETMKDLIQKEPEAAWRYIENIKPVFTWIAVDNHYKGSMQLAYFAYVIAKYRILEGKATPLIVDIMMKLLEEPSLYCRENALQAIYSTGDYKYVLSAIKCVDESGRFHHEKLLTDGLLTFTGDHQQLAKVLWEHFEAFSNSMQVVIIDYIRFSGTILNDEILYLLVDGKRDDELRFACIRYFWKHTDERAYPILLAFLEHPGNQRWEYASIAATALSSYPKERTILALKRAMNNSNWYIRFNASKTLESFHLTYQELGDVMDGRDRYAREILQYQMDVQRAKEEQEVMEV